MRELTIDILIALVTGLISGIISSWIVTKCYQRREQKRLARDYLRSYLFSCLNSEDLYIPINELDQVNILTQGKDPELRKVLFDVFETFHPVKDVEYDQKSQNKINKVLIALKTLENYYK